MKVVSVAFFTGLFLSSTCFAYRNADCKGEIDAENMFLCCAEPGNLGTSMWFGNVSGVYHCEDGERDDCGSGTHIWNKNTHKLTGDRMADVCKRNHLVPVFR